MPITLLPTLLPTLFPALMPALLPGTFAHMASVFSATTPEAKSNPILSFLPLVLIFAAMYFLLLRPQRRRQKATVSLQSSIAEGDEVVLNSGIYGFISAVEDDFFWLEIAEKVEVRVAKGSVARKVSVSSSSSISSDASTDKQTDPTNATPFKSRGLFKGRSAKSSDSDGTSSSSN